MSSQTPNRRISLRRKRILKDQKDKPAAKRSSPSFDQKSLVEISDDEDLQPTTPALHKVKKGIFDRESPKDGTKTHRDNSHIQASSITEKNLHQNGKKHDNSKRIQEELSTDSGGNRPPSISQIQFFSPESSFTLSQLPATQDCEVIWDCNSPGYSREDLKLRHKKNERSGGASISPLRPPNINLFNCSRPSGGAAGARVGIGAEELEKLDGLLTMINSKECNVIKEEKEACDLPTFLNPSQPFVITEIKPSHGSSKDAPYVTSPDDENRPRSSASFKREPLDLPSTHPKDNSSYLIKVEFSTDAPSSDKTGGIDIPSLKINKPINGPTSKAEASVVPILKKKIPTFKQVGSCAITKDELEKIFWEEDFEDEHGGDESDISNSQRVASDSRDNNTCPDKRKKTHSSVSSNSEGVKTSLNNKFIKQLEKFNADNEARSADLHFDKGDVTPTKKVQASTLYQDSFHKGKEFPKSHTLQSPGIQSACTINCNSIGSNTILRPSECDSFDDDLFDESIFKSTQKLEDALFNKETGKFNSPSVLVKSEPIKSSLNSALQNQSVAVRCPRNASELSNAGDSMLSPPSSPILGKARSPSWSNIENNNKHPSNTQAKPTKPTRATFSLGAVPSSAGIPSFIKIKEELSMNSMKPFDALPPKANNTGKNFSKDMIEVKPLSNQMKEQNKLAKEKLLEFSKGSIAKTESTLKKPETTLQGNKGLDNSFANEPLFYSCTSKVDLNDGFTAEMDDDAFNLCLTDIDDMVFNESKPSDLLTTKKQFGLGNSTKNLQNIPPVTSCGDEMKSSKIVSGPALTKSSFYSPKSSCTVAANLSKFNKNPPVRRLLIGSNVSKDSNLKLYAAEENPVSCVASKEKCTDELNDSDFLQDDIMASILKFESQYYSQNSKKNVSKSPLSSLKDPSEEEISSLNKTVLDSSKYSSSHQATNPISHFSKNTNSVNRNYSYNNGPLMGSSASNSSSKSTSKAANNLPTSSHLNQNVGLSKLSKAPSTSGISRPPCHVADSAHTTSSSIKTKQQHELAKPVSSGFSRTKSSSSVVVAVSSGPVSSGFSRTKSSSSVVETVPLGLPPKGPFHFSALHIGSKVGNGAEHGSKGCPPTKKVSSTSNPIVKYSQEEIARKKEDALKKRKHRLARYPTVC